jgi:hypothetical protein
MKKSSAKRKSGTRRAAGRPAKDLAARRPSVKGGAQGRAQNTFTMLSNIVKASSDTTTNTTTSLRG